VRFALERVNYMPKDLHPGVLYVSEEFGIAIHLCACGCGSKIRTAPGATDFSVRETPDGPSLFPSVGYWQQACQSHYWITRGEVVWGEKWTPEQIAVGHAREEERRRAYYGDLYRRRDGGIGARAWRWLRALWRSPLSH